MWRTQAVKRKLFRRFVQKNMDGKFYHICTNGLAKGLWFRDREDYVDGMNSVPICAFETDVKIYCFCLMSNHVHFIVKGMEANCTRFIREYKRRRSMQLALKYEKAHSINGSDIFMNHIEDSKYLMKAIAYVMRNPMAAGISVIPTDYSWGSANLYFADRSFRESGYRKLKDLSLSQKRKLFKSKVMLPDYYMIDYDGIVFPGSYVDYKAVEGLYNSPKRLLYHLSSTNDMESELETDILKKTSYGDSELLASLAVVCAEKFHGRKLGALKIEELYLLAREMRKRYGAGVKQLSRIMSLDYETLKRML